MLEQQILQQQDKELVKSSKPKESTHLSLRLQDNLEPPIMHGQLPEIKEHPVNKSCFKNPSASLGRQCCRCHHFRMSPEIMIWIQVKRAFWIVIIIRSRSQTTNTLNLIRTSYSQICSPQTYLNRQFLGSANIQEMDKLYLLLLPSTRKDRLLSSRAYMIIWSKHK